MKRNIELHIDELVLHGFSPGDRHTIGGAVEVELSRLIERKGVPALMAQGGDQPQLRAASLRMARNSGAECIGRQIAAAVYEGFQQSGHKGKG